MRCVEEQAEMRDTEMAEQLRSTRPSDGHISWGLGEGHPRRVLRIHPFHAVGDTMSRRLYDA